MQIPVFVQYEPLRWPPDMHVAKVHMKCSCPGTDNVVGVRCPCCDRAEKLKTANWYSRNIMEDFKSYGGGVASYFELLKYCAITLIVLAAIINIYHIYILETICPSLHQGDRHRACQSFLLVFRLCDPIIIYETLLSRGREVEAYIFFALQLLSFVYLIAVTIGMKARLQRMQMNIKKYRKVYSEYSLMLKNIPRNCTIAHLKEELAKAVPNLQIEELFFLYDLAQLEDLFRKVLDLHFRINYVMQSIIEGRGESNKNLNKLLADYVDSYARLQDMAKRVGLNNGRAIVVFNNKDQRDMVLSRYKINECTKFLFYSLQLAGMGTGKLDMIADSIAEPQEIIWKYVGESSAKKTKVKIETTAIGLGFVLLALGLLYFPILKINQANILDKSVVSTILSLLISTLLQALSLVYRVIIIRLVPRRRPSSRDSESYFIVITTVIFHFIFYIVVPVSYYVVDFGGISRNLKLKQLFVAVLMFLAMTVLAAFLDIRHRLFNSRRKKLLSSWRQWGKYCQARLHEQLQWPAFPIEYKLMVILNIWSFNAYYTFQIPYLLVVFVLVILVIYWVDKRNLYRHYKMHTYLSIDLELAVQRDYIVLFLICVCCGYGISAIYFWQIILAVAMCVLSLAINFILNCKAKHDELRDLRVSRTITLHEIKLLEDMKTDDVSILERLIHRQPKGYTRLSVLSLGSAIEASGYRSAYNEYVGQFSNKEIREMMEKSYRHCLRRLEDMKSTRQEDTDNGKEDNNTVSDSVRNDSNASEMENMRVSQVNSEKSRSLENRKWRETLR